MSEQEVEYEIRPKLYELRKKWVYSLFRQEHGFEPTENVGLLGNAEQCYERLEKAHWFEITKRKFLNSRFTKYFSSKNNQ